MKRLDQESQTTPENIFNNPEYASNEKRSIGVGAAMGIAIGGVVCVDWDLLRACKLVARAEAR